VALEFEWLSSLSGSRVRRGSTSRSLVSRSPLAAATLPRAQVSSLLLPHIQIVCITRVIGSDRCPTTNQTFPPLTPPRFHAHNLVAAKVRPHPRLPLNPSPKVALSSQPHADAMRTESPRSDSTGASAILSNSTCPQQANGAFAQVSSPSVADAPFAKDAVITTKQPPSPDGVSSSGDAVFQNLTLRTSGAPEGPNVDDTPSIISLNQLLYVRVKLASQTESSVRFHDSLEFQKAFFEQVTELPCLKGKEFLSSLHCALIKHSGPSIKHIKGCYFTAGFAFQNTSITVNVPKLILNQQEQQRSPFFLFKLPAVGRGEKAHNVITPAKVQFALEKDLLLESFRLEFVFKVPFIAPPNSIQEAASLLCQLLFLEEYVQNPNSAELLHERRRIQSLCSYADKLQLNSKASISCRTITGFFPLNLDDAESRDVSIAHRLVFGALFGIDPRAKQYERFTFSLPILSDLDQLRKKPAFKAIVEEVKGNDAFADLIVIRPRRIRKNAIDLDSALESSTSASASDSDFSTSTQTLKRHEAILMLPRVLLFCNSDFESEEFPALHDSESFKSQPVEFKLPQINDASDDSSDIAPKNSSSSRRVTFDDIPCKFFAKGSCKFSDKCKFSHATTKVHESHDVVVNKSVASTIKKNNTADIVKGKSIQDTYNVQENPTVVKTANQSVNATALLSKQDADVQDLTAVVKSADQTASATVLLLNQKEHDGQNLSADVMPSSIESRILSAIAQCPLSPNFYLNTDTLHPPQYRSNIVIGTFHFTQADYGIRFEKFWESLHLEDDLKGSPAALEKYRCFYIHLGIGTNMHPYAIHYAFRNRASYLMQSPSTPLLASSYCDSLQDALSYDSFVDSNILLTCWPHEWNHLRIIIWNEAASTWMVYEPFPDEDNLEVILAFQGTGGGAHYTLLSHWSRSLLRSLKLFLLKNDQSQGATLLSPRKKYGFELQIYAPESFAIVNKGISAEDSTQWPELNETFSFHKALSSSFHSFPFRTLPDVPCDLVETPSVWPPLNSTERFAASLFPEPCKQSGRFHTCCGSAGNCRCGVSSSRDNIHGCGDSSCHWRPSEDPYHFLHDLTLHAFSDVLQRIGFALPRWVEIFDRDAKDKAVLGYVITERLMTIYCTLQHRYVSLEDEENLFYMRSSLISLRLLALEAIKIIGESQTIFPVSPLSILNYMIETIESNARTANFDQALDSIESTQSSDVPIVSSNPKYNLERDEECSRALNFVKHVYSLATKRLHSITQEGKLVAIEQLHGLRRQVLRIAETLNNLGHGLSSLPAKRAVCTQSVQITFESAMIIATELNSLIEKISTVEFPRAPPLPKPSARPGRKSHAVEIIDPMLLESLCKTIEELIGKDAPASLHATFKSQRRVSTPSLKTSNQFAPLAELDEDKKSESKVNAHSGDEDAAVPQKESSSDGDVESNQEGQSSDSDCSSEDHEREEDIVNERRAAFGSTASPFLAEARNIHSTGNKDSFDSAAGDSAHSSDRGFVDDTPQKARGTSHRTLFNAQTLRDAGLLSPRSIAVTGINIIYCPKGHEVNLEYKTPRDNERRKINQIICSTCLAVVQPSQQAYNCLCVSHIVCQLCVQSSTSFPKPPECKRCKQNLIHSPCTRKSCASCDFVSNVRTNLWICENKSCRAAFCKDCVPPPDASFKPGRVPSSTPSLPSISSSSLSASIFVSGKPAPMLAKKRA
jgi:hypothetical protein